MYQDPQYLEVVSHVSSCPHLGDGTYHCPYCNKEESYCWDVQYNFSDKDGSGVQALPNPYDTLTPGGAAHSHMATNGQSFPSHLAYDHQMLPELPAIPRSPNSTMADQSKRKYTAAFSPYPELPNFEAARRRVEPPHMAELPTQQTTRQGSTHLSPRSSPIDMQRHSPQISHGAFPIGYEPLGVSVMGGRDPSPMISPGGYGGDGRAFGTGSVLPSSMQQQGLVGGNGQAGMVSPPKSRERGLSGTNMIGSAHTSPRQRRASSQLSGSGQIPGVIRTGTSGSSPGQTAPAEKGSVQCKQCGKILRGKVAWLPSNLQRHMREIHLSAPKTECRICGRTFNRGHNLRHHMKAVHGEQP